MPTSDVNMRGVLNVSHAYLDYTTYPEFSIRAQDMLVNIGTRVKLSFTAERSICGASGNIFNGIADNNELAMGKIHAKDRYRNLRDSYLANHPTAIFSAFIGNASLKTSGYMLNTQCDYPTDNDLENEYLPDCTGAALGEGTSPGSTSTIKVLEGPCSGIWLSRMIPYGLGASGHYVNNMQFWDEVGYTSTHWDNNYSRFTKVKADLNRSGVMVGFNLGGTAMIRPFGFAPLLFSDLPEMTNFITVEGFVNQGDDGAGLPVRNVDNLKLIRENIRGLNDSGVGFMGVSLGTSTDSNSRYILDIQESDGGTRLLVTTSGDHNIFPHGGNSSECIGLTYLPAAYSDLEAYGWTPEDTTTGNKVKLYYRFSDLSTIKSGAGIVGSIAVTNQGITTDYQSSIRFMAGMTMMYRRTGDAMFVSQVPAPDSALAGGGVSSSVDCWWYWPMQFGLPLDEYQILASGNTAAGGVCHWMKRDFESGTIYVSPSSGFVTASRSY